MKAYAQRGLYTGGALKTNGRPYPHARPFTKEARLYRALFEKHGTRACLKIEEMTDFCPESASFKEKTARNPCVLRGFSTQKRTPSGQKDGVFDVSNKP